MISFMGPFYLARFQNIDFFVKLLICMLRNWCSVTVNVLKVENKNLILKLSRHFLASGGLAPSR